MFAPSMFLTEERGFVATPMGLPSCYRLERHVGPPDYGQGRRDTWMFLRKPGKKLSYVQRCALMARLGLCSSLTQLVTTTHARQGKA